MDWEGAIREGIEKQETARTQVNSILRDLAQDAAKNPGGPCDQVRGWALDQLDRIDASPPIARGSEP